MGKNINYYEKFKDPRWQKKRLEIFERDGFCCQNCFNPNSTLHAHHLFYEEGKEPWDYNDSSIITLCEDCHSTEHSENQLYEMNRLIANTLRERGFLNDHILSISSGFHSLKINHHPEIIARALEWAFSSPNFTNFIVEMFFENISEAHKKNLERYQKK